MKCEIVNIIAVYLLILQFSFEIIGFFDLIIKIVVNQVKMAYFN
jgi:hypothetical protein